MRSQDVRHDDVKNVCFYKDNERKHRPSVSGRTVNQISLRGALGSKKTYLGTFLNSPDVWMNEQYICVVREIKKNKKQNIREMQLSSKALWFYMVFDPPQTLCVHRDMTIPEKTNNTQPQRTARYECEDNNDDHKKGTSAMKVYQPAQNTQCVANNDSDAMHIYPAADWIEIKKTLVFRK